MQILLDEDGDEQQDKAVFLTNDRDDGAHDHDHDDDAQSASNYRNGVHVNVPYLCSFINFTLQRYSTFDAIGLQRGYLPNNSSRKG